MSLVPAVGYARRSTDKQEASITEQVRAVEQYAADRGYRILRWYTDDAISGDDTERRIEFLRMLDDAQNRRDFDVILCWDQSRFGRFSPQEAGHWTYLFSKAGVRLVTTDKGPIDWSDFTGWLTYSVDQHAKHQYLVGLSRDVARGQLEARQNGGWVGQPPYGYKIAGERKAKRLVLDSENPAKVRVVQRIFKEYVHEGQSLHAIARGLQADGYPSPGHKGKPWRYDAVRVIVQNVAYTGDFAAGKYSYGKYHTAIDGRVEKSRGKVQHPEAKWVIRRDHHEAIVDRQTWEKAQTLLARGKTGRNKHTPEDNPWVFTGLLRCGKCGCPLWGGVGGRKDRTYECSNRQHNGKDACPGTTVTEPTILRSIAEHLDNWLGADADALGGAAYYGELSPEDLKNNKAFQEVKKLFTAPARPKRDRDALKKRADKIRADLGKARANLVLLDPENIPAAQDRIRQLADDLDEAERALKDSAPAPVEDVNGMVLKVLDNLWQLAYCCRHLARPEDPKWEYVGSLESSAPQRVRNLLNQTAHIVVHTDKTGEGRRTRHTFVKGEIVFGGSDTVVTGNSRILLPVPGNWPGGETGRRSGLKPRRLTACRFESGPGY